MVREAARTWLRLQGAQLPIPPVILRSAATKNPVNRMPCAATRDPSLALRMTAFFCAVYGRFVSCPNLAPFAGLPCRCRGGCRARQRPPCVKGAVCPTGRLGDCLFPSRWAVNTIPPSRLRRATSLYAREAKPLRFASLSNSPFRGGLTGAPKAVPSPLSF